MLGTLSYLKGNFRAKIDRYVYNIIFDITDMVIKGKAVKFYSLTPDEFGCHKSKVDHAIDKLSEKI